MDYGERIAKVEAVVESHKEQLTRIEQELVRQRQHNDQRFAEVRASIDALRSSMEAGLEFLRGELAQSMRWQIRITITLFLAVVGMFMALLGMLAKLGGVF